MQPRQRATSSRPRGSRSPWSELPLALFAIAGRRRSSKRFSAGAYGGEVGAEVGRLVVVLAPWMVVSVGIGVAFPLAFVAARTAPLPWIALAALALQIPLAWLGSSLLELDGPGRGAHDLDCCRALRASRRARRSSRDASRACGRRSRDRLVHWSRSECPRSCSTRSGGEPGTCRLRRPPGRASSRGLRASWRYLRGL